MSKINNIIGLDVEDRTAHWVTMRMIKESIKYLSSKKEDKYNIGIKKEKDIYKELLKEFIES